MEWLRKIIENAKVDDGKIDIEAIMKEVNLTFPRNAVPKSEFNSINEQLKKANETIRGLEEMGKGNEDLQLKLKEYETEIQRLNLEAENTKKEFILKRQLGEKGVIDPEYLIFKNGGIDKFSFDSDGNPIGVDDILNKFKQSTPVLFKTKERQENIYTPVGGKESPSNNPFAKETFNITKQGELFKENPAQAKELAAAAGVKLNI